MSGSASHPNSHCANCGSELTGPYCSQCGQHDVDYTHSFWHIAHEAVEDVFHFDGKFLKSSRYILTNPGFLTKEFNAGRRVRYAQPLRLYVFASFLFFAISALTSGNLFSRGAHAAGTVANAPAEEGGWLDGLIKVDKQPGELVDQTGVSQEFKHLLPEMLFLCVPFLALALKLVHRKTGKPYVEHLIFALHIQAFSFLFLIVMLSAMSLAGLAGHGPREAVNALFGAVLVWTIFRALRTVYGESRWRTVLHMTMAALLYWIVVTVGMIIVAVVSLKLLAHS